MREVESWEIFLAIFLGGVIILVTYLSYGCFHQIALNNEIQSKITPVAPYDKICSVNTISIDCGWYIVSIRLMDCDNGHYNYCLCKYNENTHKLTEYDSKLITFDGD